MRLQGLPTEILFIIFDYLKHEDLCNVLETKEKRLQTIIVERYCVLAIEEFRSIDPFVNLAVQKNGWGKEEIEETDATELYVKLFKDVPATWQRDVPAITESVMESKDGATIEHLAVTRNRIAVIKRNLIYVYNLQDTKFVGQLVNEHEVDEENEVPPLGTTSGQKFASVDNALVTLDGNRRSLNVWDLQEVVLTARVHPRMREQNLAQGQIEFCLNEKILVFVGDLTVQIWKLNDLKRLPGIVYDDPVGVRYYVGVRRAVLNENYLVFSLLTSAGNDAEYECNGGFLDNVMRKRKLTTEENVMEESSTRLKRTHCKKYMPFSGDDLLVYDMALSSSNLLAVLQREPINKFGDEVFVVHVINVENDERLYQFERSTGMVFTRDFEAASVHTGMKWIKNRLYFTDIESIATSRRKPGGVGIGYIDVDDKRVVHSKSVRINIGDVIWYGYSKVLRVSQPLRNLKEIGPSYFLTTSYDFWKE